MQILPLQEKIDFLSNEKRRLEQKIAEGRITAPVRGTVSQIYHVAGERVGREPVIDIVEDGTTKFVLYYRPDQRLPSTGEELGLWVSSTDSHVDVAVSGHSKDTMSAPAQIKRKYKEDERLVRVFLQPVDGSSDLVVGSVVMKPTSLRRVANMLFPEAAATNLGQRDRMAREGDADGGR
jgi:hypothetical protein